MARFFIDRPVFAIVIAIVTVILGAVAIPNLPIASYPEVVPPVVQITANLRGGNAQDLERTVAQPVEQQLVALDGLLFSPRPKTSIESAVNRPSWSVGYWIPPNARYNPTKAVNTSPSAWAAPSSAWS